MRKFDFRLHRLLRVRESLERHQTLTCQNLEQRIRKSIHEQDLLESEMKETMRQAHPERNQKIDLLKVSSLLSYLDLLEQSNIKKKKEIEQLQIRLNQERKVLVDRMQEKRTLEIMKENVFLLYRKEIEKQYQKWLDDYPNRSWQKIKNGGFSDGNN